MSSPEPAEKYATFKIHELGDVRWFATHQCGKRCVMKRVISTLAIAAACSIAAQAVSAQTLKTVRERGTLVCGVSQGLPGFSTPDDRGNWTGLDVDLCRAIAAAIFNDPGKVKYSPLAAKDRFTALQSGEIDILSRNTTWTLSRD